jgi:hypothetical protein
MDPAISLFTLFVLLLTFASLAIGAQVLRRQGRTRLALRRIAAYQSLPLVIGEAVESERPIHISYGGSGLGADSTVSALAVNDLLYTAVERAAIARRTPIISMSDPTALPLAQGTLQRAYARRRNLETYRASIARWYPQGPRSLAFAAGVSGALADEDANLSVAAGRFGPEIAFIGETATRYDQRFIGHSDQLDGQAVAWVMADAPLIGEELYVAGAYLPAHPSAAHLAQILAQDGLRIAVIVVILLVALLTGAQQTVLAVVTLVNTNPVLVLGTVALILLVILGGAFLLTRLRRRRGG